MRINRRSALLGGLGTATWQPRRRTAQQIQFFRIGTGGTAGTYFPIGGLLANAIYNPRARACADGGSCGVPGLVATAVASNGSVANINAIAGGSMESGFTQSDVAYWAFTGTGVFDGKPKVEALRRSPIFIRKRSTSSPARIPALPASPISRASASRSTSRAPALWSSAEILGAFGLTEKDIKAEYLKPRSGGRQDPRRRPSTRSSSSAAIRPARSRSSRRPAAASISCRSPAPKSTRCGKAIRLLRAPTRFPPNTSQGHRRSEDGERQRHLGDVEQAARAAHLRHHRGPVESQHPQAAQFRPCQGQGDQARDGDAGPRHPAACRARRSSTRRRGSSSSLDRQR